MYEREYDSCSKPILSSVMKICQSLNCQEREDRRERRGSGREWERERERKRERESERVRE